VYDGVKVNISEM